VDKLEEYVAKAKKKKLYMSTINAVESHLGKMVSVIFSQRMATKNNEYDMDKGDVDDGHEKAEEEGWISGAISGFSQAKKKHRFVGYWQKGN